MFLGFQKQQRGAALHLWFDTEHPDVPKMIETILRMYTVIETDAKGQLAGKRSVLKEKKQSVVGASSIM